MAERAKYKKTKVFVAVLLLTLFFLPRGSINADHNPATLFLVPDKGHLLVGETFTVSVYIDTGGNYINAIEADLSFAPDKLQVVSPSSGSSIIENWIGQPSYSNTSGTISFRGTILNPGINVSRGLISTITFRVKNVGETILEFSENSKVLLNDGSGTDVLSNTRNATFNLVLPPPAGPEVRSQTHPDQGRWYNEPSVEFEWSSDIPGTLYSYVLDKEPITTPDNIPEGDKNSVVYQSVSSGINYFHIKSYANGIWGGTSHYSVSVDANPPAEFPILVGPGKMTTEHRLIISFNTTDRESGMNHYEIKIVPLSKGTSIQEGNEKFYAEVTSPYIPELPEGKYDVVIRAYDNAGNFREVTERVQIMSPALKFITWFDDLWFWLVLVLLILLFATAWLMVKYRRHHIVVHGKLGDGGISREDIAKKLAELKELQEKYMKMMPPAAIILLVSLGFLFHANAIFAETLTPTAPLITTFSPNIGNDELLYVGGKENISGSRITIYIQNKETGERISFETTVDEKGDWFYAHDDFLPSGEYQLWAQAHYMDLDSPPSSQSVFVVSKSAIKLGASRLSFDLIYFVISLILLLAVIILMVLTIYHYKEAKRKRRIFVEQIHEMERSIERGFILVKRDIEEELRILHRAKMSNALKFEELAQEKKLLEDLERVSAQIGRDLTRVEL